MLVLTRKKDERIRIGRDVMITLVEIRGDKVRIGIDAPKSLPITRTEIEDRFPPPKEGTDAPA